MIFILVLLGIGMVIYYFFFTANRAPLLPKFTPTQATRTAPTQASPVATEMKINGRKVINLPAGKTEKDLPDFIPQNIPSPEWQKSVKKALLLQAGGKLKDLKINTVESLVWIQNQTPLNVESVMISFRDPQNREIAFRALVDSQSGRLLQTWDQPVMDDFQNDSNEGIGLDPRYQED